MGRGRGSSSKLERMSDFYEDVNGVGDEEDRTMFEEIDVVVHATTGNDGKNGMNG